MTAEAVAPLDAYVTADPDEPTFTLQGGDPLAGPLVLMWAVAARVRAGVASPEFIDDLSLRQAALDHSVADDDRELGNLLVRATAAEKVSWSMGDYLKGNHTDAPEDAGDSILDEAARIELHDLRVRVAQKLSNFRCEIEDMREALQKVGFTDQEPLSDLKTTAYNLHLLNQMIEPRRLFKKKD